MIKLCRLLLVEHPEGSIFRNTHGKPWSRNAIRMRFRQLRQKLHLEPRVVAYCYRHSFHHQRFGEGDT